MHSVADLTTFARKTTGEVPPHFVGASSTILRSKLYVFGGRFNVENKMSSDIYELDLRTWIWVKLEAHPDDELPRPRYFHSADTWNNHLVIFGGMGYKEDAATFEKEDLCVYDDIRLFNLTTRRWLPAATHNTPHESSSQLVPGSRYAHLSSVNGDRLTIIGGQDLLSQWLGDIHVYDLKTKRWISKVVYPKYCGAYRSIAVSSPNRVVSPRKESPESSGFPGVQPQFQLQNAPLQSFRQRAPLVHLPYSEPLERPNDSEIYLYSNYNFTDVKRELVVVKSNPGSELAVVDKSDSMGGQSLPPGLRFPTGAMVGNHLLIAGTYLAHTHQSYSIWLLDLMTMQWTRLEAGAVLSSGSWCRGCLWEEENKFLVFGNRQGNLVEDYNRRILSWDDVASIDMEAYGIYPPPKLELDLTAQELGLAALEEELLSDFEVVCDDGRRIKCNRKVLERRWPWFEQQRRLYLSSASKALENIPRTVADIPLPELPDVNDSEGPPPDPRLTPRAFFLSEPYAITLGFLQYLYSLALITSLQHAPAVLSGLLLLATTYDIPHLASLVRHAMHGMLTPQTSVGVYEMATVCDCQNLQIRALKFVMMGNRKPGTRHIPDSSGRRPDDYGGTGGGGGGGGPNGYGGARGRGISDPRSDTSDSAPTLRANGINGRMTNMSVTVPQSSSENLMEASTSSLSPSPSRTSPVRALLPPIPEKLDNTADPLLKALESHAHSRRHLSRQMSEGSISASYGEMRPLSIKQNGLHRRVWSSTGDVDDVPAFDRQKRSRQRLLRNQYHSSSSLQLNSESEAETCLLETPALTRASSFNRAANDSDVTTPTTANSTNPGSPYLVTPVDNISMQYYDRKAVNTVVGDWHVSSGTHDHHEENFLDLYDRDSKAFVSESDERFAPTKRRGTEQLRHSSSTPALNMYQLPAKSAMEPDSSYSDFDTSEDGHPPSTGLRSQEKSLLSRLRSFSFGPVKGLSSNSTSSYTTPTGSYGTITLGGL